MNNIDTLSSQTSYFITDLIKSLFLPQIVKYLNDRQSDDIPTVEELTKVLYLSNVKITQGKSVYTNSNKKCVWEFKRGKTKGNVCNKPTMENSDYCSSCIKRVTFKKQNLSNSELTISNNITYDLPIVGCNEITALDAKPYDKSRGLYQCNNSYIFRLEKSNTKDDVDNMYIIGKLDENEELIKLSNEEFDQAVNDGYLIDKEYEF